MNNTYVEKAYKYGVITYPDECEEELKEVLVQSREEANVNLPRKREFEVTMPVRPECILDFDSISGLTIKDVKDYKELLYDDRYLIFVMYDSINVQKPYYTKNLVKVRGVQQDKAKLRYICSVDMKKYDNMAIDDLIGNILVGNNLGSCASYLNEGNKKRALCFLEKYIYGDKEHAYNAAFYNIKK
jgi:hypothetical protein